MKPPVIIETTVARTPEAAPPKVEAVVAEEIGSTKAKLLALLARLADEEPDYMARDTTEQKKARAQWISESLAALARAVLGRRPKVETLKNDPDARNKMIQDLRDPLKAQLGSTPATKPRFLGW